jgi:hypothetical protein
LTAVAASLADAEAKTHAAGIAAATPAKAGEERVPGKTKTVDVELF